MPELWKGVCGCISDLIRGDRDSLRSGRSESQLGYPSFPLTCNTFPNNPSTTPPAPAANTPSLAYLARLLQLPARTISSIPLPSYAPEVSRVGRREGGRCLFRRVWRGSDWGEGGGVSGAGREGGGRAAHVGDLEE